MQKPRDEDRPQYQPGDSQYRPQTTQDEEIKREFDSEFDDRIDPSMSDGDLDTESNEDSAQQRELARQKSAE